MAETVGVADAVDFNRVSIPFLRIQERKWLLAAVDAAICAAVMVGAYKLWRLVFHPAPQEMASVPWEWVLGTAAIWLIVSWLAGAYELDTADRFPRAARITVTVAAVTLIAAVVGYYLFLKTYPRPALMVAAVVLPTLILGWRAVYAATLRRHGMATRLLVVGPVSFYSALAAEAVRRQSYYRVVGFVSGTPEPHPANRGDISTLDETVRKERVHGLVVAPRQELSDRLVSALCACVERGVQVLDFNTAYEEIAEKVAVEHVDRHWLAALPTRPANSRLEEAAIRVTDMVGALLGLAATIILGPFIAAAIYIDSGRPVFYRQTRLGLGGRPFTLTKFRSMRPDAEAAGERWAVSDDQRVTRIGRFIRRTHLDELPQFWSVLAGDMSLVGPRPERPSFTDELSRAIPFYRLRLAVRPGLTGLKQIRVGYAATPDEHLDVLRHDLYYIKHRSLALNALIVARTLGAVLGMRGR
jgi:exopolysaccharide biosynthesis polyprenyl glycosylphosphotransferase